MNELIADMNYFDFLIKSPFDTEAINILNYTLRQATILGSQLSFK